MHAAPESLNLFLLFLLSAPVCILSFRLLFPRLSPFCKRLAFGFAAAGIAAFALWMIARLASSPGAPSAWLGPAEGAASLLGTAQLALIGVVALATALIARQRPASMRLYWLGLALVLPYIGLDDYYDWRALSHIVGLENPFILLGLAVAGATIMAALQSSKRARIWHLCMLAGLALAGAGGFVFDGFPDVCGRISFLRVDGCLTFRFTEEVFEYMGFWLALVAALGQFTDASPLPSRRARLALCIVPALAALMFMSNTILPKLASIASEPAASQATELRDPPGDGQSEANDSLGTTTENDKPAMPTGDAAQGGYKIAFKARDLVFPFLFALYATLGALSFQLFIPKLTRAGKRLAGLFFAAQVLTLAPAFGLDTDSSFDMWLWNMGQEYNIHSLLSSTQLALVGCVAFVSAWLARSRNAFFRLYLLAIGLVFIFLAYDEYAVVHENIANWERYYAALGMALAAATVYAAARSPRRLRIWHGCFLVGIAISAVGIVLYDMPRQICAGGGILPLKGCLWTYNYEEPLEMAGIWLALLAMLGLLSDIAPSLRRRFAFALFSLPALWIALLLHGALIPRLELRFAAEPSDIQFESGVALLGYRVDRREDAIVMDVYASALHKDYRDLGFSAHLIDQADGGSVAKTDLNADHQVGWLFAPGMAHIYRQRIEVDIPPAAPRNRAMWIALSAWREVGGEYTRQTVLRSDTRRLGAHSAAMGEFVLWAQPTAETTRPLASFTNGFTLQSVDMPESAKAGATIPVTFAWRSDVASDADYTQFLHLSRADTENWSVLDQQPLGARLPTRFWYKGMADRETWQAPLSSNLAPGTYTVFTGLYRASDQARLSFTDANGFAPPDARLPLGELVIDA